MLSQKIKQLRLAKSLNQVELAKKIGVTKQCISNWENDNIQPSIEMLIKLSDFFGVTTDYLLGLEDKKMLNVSGLSLKQIEHLKLIVEDITENSVVRDN